jgi:hypothetical protein
MAEFAIYVTFVVVAVGSAAVDRDFDSDSGLGSKLPTS